MRRRALTTLLTTLAALGLIAASLAAPAAAHSTQSQRPRADSTQWCSTPTAPPCVLGATRNGVTIAADDPDWVVSASGAPVGDGEYSVGWSVADKNLAGTLIDMGTSELGQNWTVSIDMGHHVPRSTDTYGDDVTVTRQAFRSGDYHVTIAGQPTTFEDNSECQPVTPVTCPNKSSNEVTYFGGEADDFGQWSDPSQLNDFYGMDSWTNIEETDIPPQITGDPAEIEETLVNSHLRPNDDVFQGFYHIILPNKFLVDMGVDDPSTLATDGISATIGSGSVTVTPGPTSTEVDVTGITFSPRHLRVKRGDVKPGRPSKLHAHRSSSHRGRLSFHHSKAHGSRITGYQGRCLAARHATRHVSGKHSPLVVKGLHAGVAYHCQVRAKSKAGSSSWTKHHKLAA